MLWFTVPPVISRMVGPLFGGAIVSITFVEDTHQAAAPLAWSTHSAW
jgi:hypothetical protein